MHRLIGFMQTDHISLSSPLFLSPITITTNTLFYAQDFLQVLCNSAAI